jgi:hypothetical protein
MCKGAPKCEQHQPGLYGHIDRAVGYHDRHETAAPDYVNDCEQSADNSCGSKRTCERADIKSSRRLAPTDMREAKQDGRKNYLHGNGQARIARLRHDETTEYRFLANACGDPNAERCCDPKE